MVAFARRNSPFYAELYRDLPDELESLTDLPVIDQVDFWTANQWPDNRLLTGPLTDAGVYTSGGTTGAPKVSPWTRAEHFDSTSAFGAGMVRPASARSPGREPLLRRAPLRRLPLHRGVPAQRAGRQRPAAGRRSRRRRRRRGADRQLRRQRARRDPDEAGRRRRGRHRCRAATPTPWSSCSSPATCCSTTSARR